MIYLNMVEIMASLKNICFHLLHKVSYNQTCVEFLSYQSFLMSKNNETFESAICIKQIKACKDNKTFHYAMSLFDALQLVLLVVHYKNFDE